MHENIRRVSSFKTFQEYHHHCIIIPFDAHGLWAVFNKTAPAVCFANRRAQVHVLRSCPSQQQIVLPPPPALHPTPHSLLLIRLCPTSSLISHIRQYRPLLHKCTSLLSTSSPCDHAPPPQVTFSILHPHDSAVKYSPGAALPPTSFIVHRNASYQARWASYSALCQAMAIARAKNLHSCFTVIRSPSRLMFSPQQVGLRPL
jgi:hypothetical protein